MAWSTPKVDWATDDAVGTTDLNRSEGNIADIRINAAANGRMGVATITATNDVTVSNTSVTANTRIFLTVQSLNGGAAQSYYVSARTPGASFVISGAASLGENTVVAYLLFEPQ